MRRGYPRGDLRHRGAVPAPQVRVLLDVARLGSDAVPATVPLSLLSWLRAYLALLPTSRLSGDRRGVGSPARNQ
jgi:hypothetical protein